MPATLRLTKKEQDQLHRKCIELNKKLIKAEKMPVTESELAHIILSEGIGKTLINSSFKVKLE